ncbi:MAG TPA: PSD1 and planctomycete cytochrome C domain-containing protein [Tepidisphaeraceae bacterium]|nr:PSD1 and planctomycete cytochrome C domain-containing protein [Tepidisphaeraceae bacterium]
MRIRGWIVGGLLAAAGIATAAQSDRAAAAGPAPSPPPSNSPAPANRPAPAATGGTRKIDYNRDVRAILSDNCFYCHGHDPSHREAKLRLDTKEGLFDARDDTHPVVPGRPDESTLYLRITSDDPDLRMPHHKSNKSLAPAQVETLRQWIEQGAQWKEYWAYTPPQRPAAPTTPRTVESFPTRNDIDKFLLAAMVEQGLEPAPQADRRTLARRLSLDLTGLPPKPEDVDAFVADTDASAHEKLVDRLLASPHYGERMSVYWMDLVRYGDTIGFHSDNPREVWPWRDWCIKSFNDNKRFDQFTLEQIAGDLLPDATREQKVGSAYNRLLLTTGEGGAQAKEYVQKHLADRVRNVSTTWMGATMGCAQCHDHKFDPYTQKDFYRMGAFFADIQEPAISLPSPELLLPTPEQEAELKRLDDGIAAAKAKLEVTTPELAAEQLAWERKLLDEWSVVDKQDQAVKWTPLKVDRAVSSDPATTMNLSSDGTAVYTSGANPPTATYTITTTAKLKGVTAVRVEALPHDKLPAKGPGRAPNGNFVLTEFDLTVDKGLGPTSRPVALVNASASHEQVSHGGNASPFGRYSAAGAIDGDKFGPKWGWAILGRAGLKNHAVFETAFDVGSGDELALRFTLKQNLGDAHALGHFRLSATDAPRPIRALHGRSVPDNIGKLVEIDPAKRRGAQQAELAAYYRGISKTLAPARKELAELTADRAALTGPAVMNKYNQNKIGTIARTLISVSGPPRVVRVLPRGNWQDDTGEVVAPGVPAFMKQIELPPDRGPSRLDLARWLVARDNPLTARVFVNRLWKLFYGQGIAKPLDDLGAQSDWPTHPELLDWLAVEFMDSGWDVKHVVRLMVNSSAYRMSSAGPKDARERDPYNKYLARQSAFRLDAEFVRDNALAISGLLVDKLGGPSVRPYQPAGYWEFLNFPKREYEQDHGEKLYRRGLYTWWQRTFLNPSLLNFDAPSHEECTAERVRSNTPQQALTLLNDPTYVEAARVFAARIVRECDGDDAARIAWAFRRALARAPAAGEVEVLTALLAKQRARYRFDAGAANALTDIGEAPPADGLKTVELAAWTSVARTILNLHETITRN